MIGEFVNNQALPSFVVNQQSFFIFRGDETAMIVMMTNSRNGSIEIIWGTANYFAASFSRNRRFFKETDKWIRVRPRGMKYKRKILSLTHLCIWNTLGPEDFSPRSKRQRVKSSGNLSFRPKPGYGEQG